jgi:hypothetical protein
MIYKDLDKIARRIALGLVMYIVTSYVLMVVIREEFIDCAVKGCLVCAVALPIINSHYS